MAPRTLNRKDTMINENTTNDDEHITNKNWQQVLAFGADIVESKAKNQSQQIDMPVFVVLP